MGYMFVAQRLRTPFAELDLVFLDEHSVMHVVEVKTVNHGMPYISSNQRERLKRALSHLSRGRNGFPRCHLALVGLNRFQMVWDFLKG